MIDATKEKGQLGEVGPIHTHNTQAGKLCGVDLTAGPTNGQTVQDEAQCWESRKVAVFKGQYDSHNSAQKPNELGNDYKTMALGQVFCMNPASVDKADAPAMIPSSYFGFDARTHEVQRLHGSFVALTGDIDKGNSSKNLVEAATRSFVGDHVAFLIYSSSSASANARKWRVLIPLAQPCSFQLWNELQHAFFGFMEGQGLQMDWALERAAQPVFLPNVSPMNRGAEGEPLFYERLAVDGDGLGADSPVVANWLSAVRQKKAQADAAADQARAKARAKALERKASGSGSVVEAFNRATSIEEMLISNGYVQGAKDAWRSPYQSSKSFATKNYGDHWVSLSGSDGAAGLGASCAAGRHGDAFDLYCHFEHGGDMRKAVRAAAMELGLAGSENSHIDIAPGIKKLIQEAQETRKAEAMGEALGSPAEAVEPGVVAAQDSLAGFQILEMPLGMRATEFVIDGFLPNGVTVIAGAPGAGKTTNLEPMAACAAHLTPAAWGFHPKRRRVVVWLSEHPDQVFDTIEALLRLEGSASREEFAHWFKVLPTKRSSPEELAALITAANARFSWTNDRGVVVHPLIVWDTAAATIDVENENDNTVISKAIALAKQVLGGGALWVITHTPKANKDATDAAQMSARGGSAYEGDANCTAYLLQDKDGRRVLALGKIRFAAAFPEIHFDSARHTETIVDNFDGQELDKTVVCGVPKPGSKQDRQQAKVDTHKLAQRDAVLQAAITAAEAGAICSANDLLDRLAIPIRRCDFNPLINRMIDEGVLVRVPIPQKVRQALKLNNRKTDAILPASSSPDEFFSMALPDSVGSQATGNQRADFVKSGGVQG